MVLNFNRVNPCGFEFDWFRGWFGFEKMVLRIELCLYGGKFYNTFRIALIGFENFCSRFVLSLECIVCIYNIHSLNTVLCLDLNDLCGKFSSRVLA